jgi:protein gp37
MSDDTGIEWTHVPGYRGATWNPVRGCTKISPGCKHCYAETFAERWRGIAGHPYEQGFDLRLVPEKLDEPIRKRDPRAYFVNSMSDLFQQGVPFEFVAATFGVMAATQRHIHMILTKRADRMAEFMQRVRDHSDSDWLKDSRHPFHNIQSRLFMEGQAWPLPNVWLGVSVEDRKYGLPRIDILRETPAAIRFLSVEPLLEDLGDIDLTGIHWVVIGGESGNGARVCNVQWIHNVVAQCRKWGVAVFVKQVGSWAIAPADPRNVDMDRDRLHTISRKGGDINDLPPDLRIREFPKAASK